MSSLASRLIAPLLTLSVLLLLSAPACGQQMASDWPQFRGPTGMGIANGKGAPLTWSEDENVLWKVELPGAGTSSPIVVKDKIFLTCYRGFNVPREERGSMEDLERLVVCLSAKDGQLLWSKPVPSQLPEQEKIREEHGYASSTPVADESQLYVFFGKSGVFAFDHSGNPKWQADVGDTLHGWGSAASPTVHGNLVLVNASVESESLVALDKRTGKRVWRAPGIKESWHTPLPVKLPGGKTELVIAIMGSVLGFDPATGDQLWSCETGIGWYMVPALVESEGVVYCIGGRSGGALAVRAGGRGDVTATHRLWTGTKGSNVSSPIYHQGHLYWMHENLGIAYCAEAKSGEIVYEERLPRAGQVYAAPVLADGRIYYLTRDGKCFVVAAQPKFELLATNQLGERAIFNSSPAVSGSRLLIRSEKTLYCLGHR